MSTPMSAARPPWAAMCWVDDNAVYLEIPAKSGPPYVQKFALSEAGFAKALAFARSLHRKERPSGGYYELGKHPLVNRKPGGRLEPTAAQREKVRGILKKAGLI